MRCNAWINGVQTSDKYLSQQRREGTTRMVREINLVLDKKKFRGHYKYQETGKYHQSGL